MKRCILLIVLSNPLFLFSQNFQLDLTKAQAAGSFIKGDSIHIWADKTAALDVFTHWTGDGAQYLQKSDEWHTSLVVPTGTNENQFSLIANYETLENPSIGTFTINQWGEENENSIFIPTDKLIHYAHPSEPKAIAFFIHGTGGHSASWFNNFEKLSIVKDFVHQGYAVFALNSNETTLGDQDGDGKTRWENDYAKQDTTSNVDFKNVINTKQFIEENFSWGDLPVFMVGGSNGANFADYCTAVLDFEASTHLTGNGNTAFFNNYSKLKPVIWVQSINDNNGSADSTKAQANYQALISQGIKTEWHWLRTSPAYPLRFMRSTNGIGAALSTNLYDSLKNQGYLNPEDYLNINNVNVDFPLDEFTSHFNLTNPQINDFVYQLNVINADHGANGNFNKTILHFFNNCLETSSLKEKHTEENNPISIFPNPTKGLMTISLKNKGPFRFQLQDIHGHLLKHHQEFTGSYNLDISDLASGVYFVTIFTEGQILSKRLIKQ